jgi:hypothetical protein
LLQLALILLQLALTLLHLAMALLHLALTLLQLLLYLSQQVGHIIGRLNRQGPEKGCGQTAMSDRATYEASPSPRLAAITDHEFREFGVRICSQLRLARHADDGIPGTAQWSDDLGGRRFLLPQPDQLVDAFPRPGDLH